MKKKILYLSLVSIVLIGCKSETLRTPIKKDFCYEIQALNDKGELMNNQYECMLYAATEGEDFQSAYAKLEPEINQVIEGLRKAYENSDLFDAQSVEMRQTKRSVRNAPNDKLEYTSIDIFVYNIKPYNDYITAGAYCVIDSEGNVYHIQIPED